METPATATTVTVVEASAPTAAPSLIRRRPTRRRARDAASDAASTTAGNPWPRPHHRRRRLPPATGFRWCRCRRRVRAAHRCGSVFNEVLARPSQPGYENQLGDAHRALERETRDDGWAYTMEARNPERDGQRNEHGCISGRSTSNAARRSAKCGCRARATRLRLSSAGARVSARSLWAAPVPELLVVDQQQRTRRFADDLPEATADGAKAALRCVPFC